MLKNKVFVKHKIVSGYDQEIPQSQTADEPMASWGGVTQQSRLFIITIYLETCRSIYLRADSDQT